jgi:hypothetical protein
MHFIEQVAELCEDHFITPNLFSWFCHYYGYPNPNQRCYEHDIVQYQYQEFLDNMLNLYHQSGDQYYWFNGTTLVSDGGSPVIPSGCIRIRKQKVRDIQIQTLLK